MRTPGEGLRKQISSLTSYFMITNLPGAEVSAVIASAPS